MFNWRQTSAGLHRSVHTASTAWTLSGALISGEGVRFFRSVFFSLLIILVEVISKFLFVVLLIGDTEFEFALLGAEHDRLAVHPPHHVEGRLGFAAQGQFEQVLLNALFDSLAQLRLDLEEAVGGAQSFDALVGPLVVVMFDPELDAFPRRLEAVELGADEEVLPDGGPEAFHLAEGHWMMRAGFDVRHPILLEFRFEAAGAAPTGVLAAVVGEHLLGRLELARRHAIDFDHRLRRGAAEQVRAHDEPRVIIHEGDEIRVTSAQSEREDVRLPHLVGRGPFKETGPGDITLFTGWTIPHEIGFMQPLANGLRTGRQEEPAAQHLRDAFDAEGGILPLEFEDLVGDRRGQPVLSRARLGGLQPRLPIRPERFQPQPEAGSTDADFLTYRRHVKAFLQIKPDGLELFVFAETTRFFRAASPPRGAVPLLLY